MSLIAMSTEPFKAGLKVFVGTGKVHTICKITKGSGLSKLTCTISERSLLLAAASLTKLESYRSFVRST